VAIKYEQIKKRTSREARLKNFTTMLIDFSEKCNSLSCLILEEEIYMTAKACSNMVLSQFELSKITLKNLNKFDLSPTAKLVLLALVDCYNPRKEEIYPKQSTIVDQLGISISSVKRAIKELADSQIIIYELKNTNRYKFTQTFFNVVNLTSGKVQNESSSCIKLNPT
jgi:hypothetical protein